MKTRLKHLALMSVLVLLTLSYLRQERYDAVLDYAGKLDKKRFAPDMAMHISLAAGDAGQPGIIEASGYDSAMMLFQLVANPDIKDRIALKNDLYDMPGFPGVTGEIAFDQTGEAVRDLYLIEIIGGRFAAIQ